jgi:hypothetical protein
MEDAMNLPRDPNEIEPRGADPIMQEPLEPLAGETNSTAERNEIRRSADAWGLVPGLLGLVIIIALGVMIFAGGDRTATPDRTTSTDVQTPASTPKTAPTQPQ